MTLGIVVDGIVSGTQTADVATAHDEFLDAFIAFLEARGWAFNGATRVADLDDESGVV